MTDEAQPEQKPESQTAEQQHTGPQSSVMQPPCDEQDDVKPAAVSADGTGSGAPTATADGPGLSPAFHDNDLVTDGPHTAPVGQEDSTGGKQDEAPKIPPPANTPGQPLADMMPTDEIQKPNGDPSELTTCPVCQYQFKAGADTL